MRNSRGRNMRCYLSPAKVDARGDPVLGDTYTISPTTVLDVRASFLRFIVDSRPPTCCNFDFGLQPVFQAP